MSASASAAPRSKRLQGAVVQGLWLAGIVIALLGLDRGLDALVQAESFELVSDYTLLVMRFIGINIIMAASLHLVNGLAGQFSIGHAGFMAIGAYTSAALTLTVEKRFPEADPAFATAAFVGSLLVGGLLAAVAGYLVGLPSLRLRGDYLAIVTLGFGEIIRVGILNVDALGGSRGMYGISGHASMFWVAFLTVLTIIGLHRLARSDFGRTLLAIREDEVAAEAMGIDTTTRKVQAFAIAAFFAGVAGGLFAHTLAYLNPNSFTFIKSFDYVVMVILGGMGSLSGAIVAATLLTVLLEILRPSVLADWIRSAGAEGAASWVQTHDLRISLYAVLLIAMMILKPSGLFGTREIWEIGPLGRVRKWLTRGDGDGDGAGDSGGRDGHGNPAASAKA